MTIPGEQAGGGNRGEVGAVWPFTYSLAPNGIFLVCSGARGSVVNTVITEMGVIECGWHDGQKGLTLTEIADGVSVEDVRAATGAELRIPDDLKPMAQI